MSLSWLTQLKAPLMFLARNDGLVAGALYVVLVRSHSWAVVRLVVRASIEDRWARDPSDHS